MVGAGPHALTAACYLLAADPALHGRIAIADRQPWLAAWHTRFRRLEIPVLRSACVHHPAPGPYALVDWARARGRSVELSGPVGAPTTGLFAAFCRWLVIRHRLGEARLPRTVTALHPRDDGRIDVELSDGCFRAGSVLLAVGGAEPVAPLSGRHSEDVDPSAVRAGQVVVVVGGGLTAGHLALRAAERGARVVLVVRAPLRARSMDVEAGWLGAELPRFAILSPPARARGIRRARTGTVPGPVRQALLDHPGIGVHVGSVVEVAPPHRVSLDDGRQIAADHVWWATGYVHDVARDPLTAALAREVPVSTAAGLPVLGNDLSWGGSRVYVTGGLAALEIGPAARGLAGARMAAERYTEAITGVAPVARQYPAPVQRAG